ncbi:hypothetical protein [Streptomyces sp. NPDC057636]|uniref:hypothetical protein n=1 Tax=Streptomyces sp. NPDC057636 TaxID=3346189 RepID=UPI00369099C5
MLGAASSQGYGTQLGDDLERGRTAGSLSLLVSLPTMLVAFARYSRDGSFAVLRANIRFTGVMAAGSIAGAVLGGLLVGVFPDVVLMPLLGVIRHRPRHMARRAGHSPQRPSRLRPQGPQGPADPMG